MDSKKLFPSDLANNLKKRQGHKYRPSNGTEGCLFMSMWCEKCKKDDKYRHSEEDDGGCVILAASFCFGVDDKEYPPEWQYDVDGQPICTAFEEMQ